MLNSTHMEKGIGPFIRDIRESKGGNGFWSLRSVASRAGISDSYLSQLEMGKVKQPLPKILKGLSKACHLSYDQLMCVAGYIEKTKNDSSKIVEIPLFEITYPDKISHRDVKETGKMYLGTDIIKYDHCVAFKIEGASLCEPRVSKGDIVIASPDASLDNGDIVLTYLNGSYSINRYFSVKDKKGKRSKIILLPCQGIKDKIGPHETVALLPCQGSGEPIVVDSKEKNFEIVGRIISVIKVL